MDFHNTKSLVIYHAGCIDGLFAAACVARYIYSANINAEVEFHSARYGNEAPVVQAVNRNVFVVDFSYSEFDMLRLLSVSASFFWADHHKTAVGVLESLGSAPDNMTVVPPTWVHFDLEKCGASLSFSVLFPSEPVPESIQYVEDYDLWKKALPQCDEVYMAMRLRLLNADPQSWGTILLCDVSAFKRDGDLLQRACRQRVNVNAGRAFELTGFFQEGINVLAVNCSDDPNELGETLCLKRGADVSVTYSQLKNKRWKFSLRLKSSCHQRSRLKMLM
jgi:hypothetical protein